MSASRAPGWPSRGTARVALFAVLLAALSTCSSASKVVLRNNGYEGVVVALEDDLPLALCQDVALGLERTVRAASRTLFAATRGRASFREVTVLVPPSWGASPCSALGALGDAAGESWTAADLRVSKGRHPQHGTRPWTLHSRGCGHHGDYVSLGHQSLTGNASALAGRQLARAWLEYRYGVFEEAGALGSPAHPPHYRAPDGAWKPNVCTNLPAVAANPACDPANLTCPLAVGGRQGGAEGDGADAEEEMEEEMMEQGEEMEEEEDVKRKARTDEGQEDEEAERGEGRWIGAASSLMGLTRLRQVTQLCDEGSHARDVPTRHNLLCGGKSVWEVLRASPDFQNNRNVEGGLRESDVSFRYVRARPAKVVLLIDDTNVMNLQKRWEFVRKAVRKVVTYDVPDGYSVGLVVFDSAAATKYPLTRLTDGATREKVGSSLPRNPSQEPHHKRCLQCGLREALRMLRQDGSGGGAGHVVLVTASSGEPLDAARADEASRALAAAGVVLHAIVYPLTERYPTPGAGLETVAALSGGRTHIVPDQGIGADSKLSMYYNLLDSLYTALAAVTGPTVLPVKVHSAEHPGGRAAVSQGTFALDPHLGADTVFAIFYYHVTHVGNLIHLVSPQGQVIDTANMQKEDANINMITVRLAEAQATAGQWHYKVENRADSHQALYVQVTSRPRARTDTPPATVRTWTSHPLSLVNASDISRPLALFAEARVGVAPVEGAKVTATITRLGYTDNGTLHEPLEVVLYDNGLTGPDMALADGVYSRFVPALPAAKYSVRVDVEGEVEGEVFTRHVRLGVVDVVGVLPALDVIPPARVVDLRASVLEGSGGRVAFTWTAPGGDMDYGVADRYVVMASRSPAQLREGGGRLLEGWAAPLAAPALQQHTLLWPDFGVVHYVALYAVDEHGNTGALSNIVSVYVPAPPSTTPVPLPSQPPVAPANTSAVREGDAGAPVLAAMDTRQLAVVFGCVGGLVALVALLACYCLLAHRRQRKSAQAKKAHEAHEAYAAAVAAPAKMGPPQDFPDGGKAATKDALGKDYMSPVESWSASQLLSSRHDAKRGSMSARSDDASDHSGSTKKSYGDSSAGNDYYGETNPYPYRHDAFLGHYPGPADQYPVPADHYPTPSQGYPTPTEGYPSPSEGYPTTPTDLYPSEGFPVPAEARSYVSSPPSESFLSVSCEMLPSSHGPPAYAAYPSYDASLRSSTSSKVPPPIPPKPKLVYTPEPYIYDAHAHEAPAPASLLAAEKRVRNVTMV
ncbi:calcium-activated chloride channel regulator 3A-1-like [Penaeus japonicus]|uniref:calcium-activated chloride channel regulator 3A-1-like n=1 Tax=Penaeus japonicus TaxID=27405 RepID=UPI001C70EF4D|nr:calcium-activated chloride channel regulator 3A-1-like [Penaeus japonicus]